MLGLLYQGLSRYGPNPLPWWPDTFLVGGLTGMLAAFGLMRLTHAQGAVRQLARVTAILWRGAKKRP